MPSTPDVHGGPATQPTIEQVWRWAYALNLVAARATLELRKALQREAGEEENWPAQADWHELVGTSHSIFMRGAREMAGIDDDAFLAVVRGEHGWELSSIADDLYERAAQPPVKR